MSFFDLFAWWKKRDRKAPRRARLNVETLEDRVQPAGVFYSVDGAGNNLVHTDWGSAGTDLIRVAPNGYADGISSPGGTTRPDARTISNTLADQPDGTPTNDRQMSAFVYAWGQFIDHDMDLTNSATLKVSFDIPVPTGDPEFDPNSTGTQTIPLSRSNYDALTGTSKSNPRQQINSITAWLDASMIYGSDATTTASLRTFSGGRLKTSDGDLLPIDPNTGMFLAGDVRANENPELTSLHTLFMREHNRFADGLAKAMPTLTDEQIYQYARMLVIAEVQAITFNEFLPALLGSAAPNPYAGYFNFLPPGIANEFSTAAFRIGHTLVGDDIEFLDNNGNEVAGELALKDAFFNPSVVPANGIDPILKYLASDRAQEVDTHVVDGLRNFLFGEPGQGGLDLAALNIQRGRDHGLADYNTTRAAYGLPRVTSFAQITSDVQVQQALQKLYGNVNNIDLWVGGIAEKHLPGSSVGQTFAKILVNQFVRLREGDRFWFQNIFSGAQRAALEKTTLADVIRRNTSLTNLQPNVFYFATSISGQVFLDVNGDSQQDRNETPAAGVTVQLLDTNGVVVASTVTKSDGTYRFDSLDLGTYKLQASLPTGWVQTTAPTTVQITRGISIAMPKIGVQRLDLTGPLFPTLN